MTDLPVSSIHIGDRIRRNLGDVDGLAENIREVGLLHPIIVDERHRLIAGRRRLEAFVSLGRKRIPVRVLDLGGLLRKKAEASENLYRLQLTPVEAEAAWRALIPRERKEAEERLSSGRSLGGKTAGRGRPKPPDSSTPSWRRPIHDSGEAARRAARDIGLSKTSLRKIAEVREAAEEDPTHYKPFLDSLDRRGAKVEKTFAAFRRERARLSVPAHPPKEYGNGDVTLLNRDFLTLTDQDITPASVDLVVTSPAYNLDKPYGSTSDSLTPDEYADFTQRWMERTRRLLKPDGRMCVNVPLDVGYHDIDFPAYAEAVRIGIAAGLRYRFTIVWDKGTSSHRTAWGSYKSSRAPHYIPAVEMIVVFAAGEWRRSSDGESDISEAEFQSWTCGPWRFPGESPNRVDGHPSAFPVDLPTRCIKLLSYVGDTVLDPFCGSGTTLLAARQLGRRAIGVEIDSASARFAARRVGLEGVPTDA